MKNKVIYNVSQELHLYYRGNSPPVSLVRLLTINTIKCPSTDPGE